MKNLILIGFMGAGKTTFGKALAAAVSVPFLDTDDVIEEQQQKKISAIFADSGEEFFRDLETGVLRQLLAAPKGMVIAVGGGLPVREENRALLRKLGTVVYLQARTDTLVERLQGDSTRPKLQGGDLRERIETLMKQRGAAYDDAADQYVQTDGKNLEDIVEELKAYVL